jgi:hypothetical protein
MEEVMRHTFIYVLEIAVSSAVVALAGCGGTQSEGFRGMTAVDHERAAQGGGDQDGVTPGDHLAAAQRLRAAEQFACVQISDDARDQGPFERRDWIMGVEEVRDRVFPKQTPQPFGIAVYLRATPGMTEQWIGRVIQCHLAHHAVVGTTAVNEWCPLLVDKTKIAVSSTPVGFRVQITSADIAIARAVIAKGQALSPSAS